MRPQEHNSEPQKRMMAFLNAQRTLGFKYNFVGRNASYKKVTLTFCMAEQIETHDMQQVKCAWSMSDAIHLRASIGRTEFPGSLHYAVATGAVTIRFIKQASSILL